MAKKTKDSNLSLDERLEQALIPNWDEPYKLPDNWCWIKIGSINNYNGHSIDPTNTPTDTFELYSVPSSDNNYPEILMGNEIGSTKQSVEKDDVLLCKINPRINRVWKVAQHTQHTLLASSEWIIVRNKHINTDYLMWCLKSPYFREFMLSNVSGIGGSLMRAQPKHVQHYPIPLPPRPEQKRIVNHIESLFAKLDEAKEKAQEVVDGFETRKAAILHKAFSGELTAKWREKNGVSITDWEHHNFSDLCKIVRGGSPRPAGSPEFYGGDIPFMKVADITRITTPYVENTEHFIKPAGLKKTRMVKANTLLLTNSGATLGVPAICTFDTTFNDGIAAFLDLEPKSLLFYYYFWTMKTPELRAINKGAAQPNLNTDIIGAVELDVPSLDEQLVIAEMLGKFISKEQQAKKTAVAVIEQIDTMKKAILARAFRGELGTNDPSEESAVELLKKVLSGGEN